MTKLVAFILMLFSFPAFSLKIAPDMLPSFSQSIHAVFTQGQTIFAHSYAETNDAKYLIFYRKTPNQGEQVYLVETPNVIPKSKKTPSCAIDVNWKGSTRVPCSNIFKPFNGDGGLRISDQDFKIVAKANRDGVAAIKAVMKRSRFKIYHSENPTERSFEMHDSKPVNNLLKVLERNGRR
ncbi:hypothetical protein C9I98_19835 [Photobacterium sanctipauli]|uniref:Uncharacterized protein n=1 Tax=Photobacterium sanctipauli TaxID=1342794 RepID=A0A2T3NNG5_9GAMM|nr:hypothetical protein [Photobacterium sanctipauli]PSW17255.1 hypothetical protein C9I98_19835 [Photobacterium sanctipauli]